MADIAQFGVEVPPVRGVEEAIGKLDQLAAAAEAVDKRVKAALAKTNLSQAQQLQLATEFQKGAIKGMSSEIQKMMRSSEDASKSQDRLGKAAYGVGNSIGSTIRQLVLYAGAFFTVKKAVDLFTSSIAEAGKKQTAVTTFKLLIDNAGQAEKALGDLKKVQGTAGIFDDEQILRTATSLKVAGSATQNLGVYTQGLAVLAAKAGVDIEVMGHAWEQAMHGRVTSSTLESNTIMEQLGRTTGKTAKEVRAGLLDGTIGAKAFTSALIDASSRTDVLATRQEDFASKIQMLAIAWNDVKEEFGKPVIDALGPLIKSWTTDLGNGKTQAQEFGEAMAGWIRTVTPMLENLGKKFQNFLIDLRAGSATLGDFLNNPATSGAMTGWGRGSTNLGPSASSLMIQPPSNVLADIASDNRATANDSTGGLTKTNQALDNFASKTKAARDATNDFAGDLKVLNDYWKDYGEVQQFSTDATSRHYHTMQALEKAIKSLGDPIKDVEKLIPGLSPDEAALARWIAWDEQVERSLKESELRMKAGMASMGETLNTGLSKMTRSWGSWQEQVSNSIGDIGNALASGISSGLTDILMGTKSVKDGFRDMALSIIKDIEGIILKMLVQLAIQQLIAAFGGGGASTLQMSGAGAYTMAGGGTVPGSGRGDKVPAMLEPGEFVIPKNQAQRYGYDKLEHIRSMASGGKVQHLAGGGQAGGGGGYYEFMTVGSNFGENNRDANYHQGVHLQSWQVSTNDYAMGTWLMIGGRWYQVADPSYNGSQRLHGNIEFRDFDHGAGGRVQRVGGRSNWRTGVYAPQGRSGGIRLGKGNDPFGGARGGKSRLPGDPRGRLLGFGGRRDSAMEFGGWSPNMGYDFGGPMDRGNRPGIGGSDFVGAGQVYVNGVPQYGPGGTNEYMTPNGAIFVQTGPDTYTQVSGPNMRANSDQSLPAGATPVGGRGGGGGGGGGSWGSGGSNTYYPKGSVGFSIPGGGNLIGLGAGSAGTMGNSDYFGRTSMRRIMKGGDGTLGMMGPGSTIRNVSTWWHPHNPGAGRPMASMLPMDKWGGIGAAAYFGGGGGSGMRVTGGHTTGRYMQAFHGGGIVGMAGGGEVPVMARGGEGIFTPAQMARMAPVSNQQTNNNVISISINNNGGSTTSDVGGNTSQPQTRELARAVVAVVQSQMAKERRVGGQNYIPRSQRGG